jgi:hypothetical protein
MSLTHRVAPEIKPEIAPPPSQQGWRNLTLYADAAVDEALRVLGDVTADPLAHNGLESAQHMTAKNVLREYCCEKMRVGTKRAVRYSDVRMRDGVRPLLHGHDFTIDLELAAKRAFKRRPVLLKAFSVLFTEEHGERIADFAKVAPNTFSLMLTLLGTELRRRSVRITGLSSYLRPTERAR